VNERHDQACEAGLRHDIKHTLRSRSVKRYDEREIGGTIGGAQRVKELAEVLRPVEGVNDEGKVIVATLLKRSTRSGSAVELFCEKRHVATSLAQSRRQTTLRRGTLHENEHSGDSAEEPQHGQGGYHTAGARASGPTARCRAARPIADHDAWGCAREVRKGRKEKKMAPEDLLVGDFYSLAPALAHKSSPK
jgi:hypothetical protein